MKHLSEEQIAQWIAGDRESPAASHVAECDRCRATIAEFEAVLANFRSSRTGLPACPPRIEQHRRRPYLWPRLVAAVAALALLIAVPLYRQQQQRERALIAQQDAQLLQQVDAEISQAVPDAMDPLVKLISQPNEGQK